MKSRTLHHFCIQTSCYDDTIDFYTKVLGFELVKEDIYVPKRIKRGWLKYNELLFEILPPKCSSPYGEYEKLNQGIPHFSFIVENAHEELEEFKNRGFTNFKKKHGKIIYRIKGGYQFKLVAPEGTEIEIRDSEML
ncbi:VOC family protein [Oceanirhabdus sp. W0125-5]|uniref:VOC family protein n=1 Tax=Oceanirhabdus sp. W0125-5 TaxID=2999116 RepID=UPI0022F31B6F|nr:VOC family protein [Oceanirhabdus sp. W0125-5]WBW96105.1 VOC family protein [Oceanirhabdus sp. W0125-5]